MLGGKQPHEIIQATREAVLDFELPLFKFLAPCSVGEVKRVAGIEDPVVFHAEMYNLVRRVEAAAAKYAQADEPHIREVASGVKLLEEPIRARMEQTRELQVTGALERAGKEYLLEQFMWALWVFKSLSARGY
mgnify:CR=1 FL=1